ncbi:MAG TPA: family 78 glycoside hydrolase catalytic domain, partial [Opitutales bacterium]|nr:family 78 glycoside hydrolase catalytic domain [Opitutales bacterium]
MWKLLAILFSAGLSSLSGASVVDLRCDYQADPLGVDSAAPRLAWQVAPGERDLRQTAYRILVASSPELLAQGESDLWDSGKVSSSQSGQVAYAGETLQPRQRCFWKVKAWLNGEDSTGWSGVGQWTMGMLESANWQARWITMPGNVMSSEAKWIWASDGEGRASRAPGPCRLQYSFELPSDPAIVDATLMATADNSVIVKLNGESVAESTDWEQGQLVDVRDKLVSGLNTFDVLAVNAGTKNGPAGMILQLRVELEDGNEVLILSNNRWEAALGEDPESFEPAIEVAPWGKGPWGRLTHFKQEKEPYEKGLPVFRKTFTVDGNLERALVHVSGLGHYELFVNGQKVGDKFLAPPWSVYEKTAYYDSYELADLLREGSNEFRIMLGKGFYNTRGDRRVHGVKSRGRLMAILEAQLEYRDGQTDLVLTDESWEAGAGPIMHNAILAGSDYDARYAEPRTWSNATEITTEPTLRAAESPAMKKFERLSPIKPAEEPEPGVFVYDFGKNLSAIPAIKVRGQKGQIVRLTPAEQRHGQTDRHNNGTGRVNQAGVGHPNYYEYTLAGNELESWEPQFTYGGFQYLELTGAVPAGYPNPAGLPVVEKVESVHVRSSAPEVGAFECSNSLFMK